MEQAIRNMEAEMQNKKPISLTHIALYGLLFVAVVLIAFGVKSLLSARAQGTTAKTPSGAVANLSADKALFKTGEEVTLHLTITNPNDFSIRVLKWFTPLEGVKQPLFTVTRDGEPVTYLGAMVKRPAPTEKDYITLAAGERITSDVNLSAFYDFSISGNYEIMYDVTSIQLYAGEDLAQLNKTGHLTSNKLSMFIEGTSAPAQGSVNLTPTTPTLYPN
jgi:peptidyl-Lys metalloendopeptidase